MNSKKGIIITVILLVVVATAVVIGKKQGWIGGEQKGITVETSKVKLKTVTSLVSASGKIQPETEVIITPDVSGEIIELTVREGDMVRKGDLILRIRPDVYQATVDQLRANVLSAKSNYERNKANLIRSEAAFKQQQSLFEKELASEMDFVTAKSTFEADKAQLKSSEYAVENAEAQLDRAKKELALTIIKAPIDGTVSKLNVELGERVVGSVQMAGTEVMRIARLEQMEVQVKVNENDIVNVAYGDTALISVDAYPNQSFAGIVTEIANSASLSATGTAEQVTDYEVKIRITTPHNMPIPEKNPLIQQVASGELEVTNIPSFKPGMTASVDIKTETLVGAIAIPIQAVTVRDFSKLSDSDSTNTEDELLIPEEDLRRVVFKVVEKKAVMTEVETGIMDDTHIVILSGVDVGDEVVIGSYRVLSKDLEDEDLVEPSSNKSKKSESNE